MIRRAEIGDHDLRAFCEQLVCGPRADAAEAAGDEKALCHTRSMADSQNWCDQSSTASTVHVLLPPKLWVFDL